MHIKILNIFGWVALSATALLVVQFHEIQKEIGLPLTIAMVHSTILLQFLSLILKYLLNNKSQQNKDYQALVREVYQTGSPRFLYPKKSCAEGFGSITAVAITASMLIFLLYEKSAANTNLSFVPYEVLLVATSYLCSAITFEISIKALTWKK